VKRWLAAIRLGVLCLLAVSALSLIHELSADRRSKAKQALLRATLSSVLPEGMRKGDLDDRLLELRANVLGSGNKRVWRVVQAGQAVALVLEASTDDGYNGRIEALIGIRLPSATHAHSEVLAVRVTSHRETPGLGDAIEHERSDWIDQFAGKSLLAPTPDQWRTERDGGAFDTLAGATVSSRALIELTARVLRFVDQHADDLRNAESGSRREYVDAE
jgi:electron transport complex protein RnfG